MIASARRAHVVTLSVYDLAADARLTPVETIAVSEPARFLSRSAAEIVRSLNPGPYFLRIVDADGRDVLELWTPRPGQGGYTVDPAYAGCSTITQNGLGMPPPCPRR